MSSSDGAARPICIAPSSRVSCSSGLAIASFSASSSSFGPSAASSAADEPPSSPPPPLAFLPPPPPPLALPFFARCRTDIASAGGNIGAARSGARASNGARGSTSSGARRKHIKPRDIFGAAPCWALIEPPCPPSPRPSLHALLQRTRLLQTDREKSPPHVSRHMSARSQPPRPLALQGHTKTYARRARCRHII